MSYRNRSCYLGCRNTTSLHELPKKAARRQQWEDFLFPSGQERPAFVSLFLCPSHFEDSCFMNKPQFDAGFAKRLLLKQTAFPTLHGPQEDMLHTTPSRPGAECQQGSSDGVSPKPHVVSVGILLFATFVQTEAPQKSYKTIPVSIKSEDVQQLLVKEEEVSTEQQECSSSLSHEEQETRVFKREEVSTTLSITPVHEKVKDEEEDEGESLTSRSIQHIKTEAEENKCGEPDLNSILLSDHQRSLSSESDTDDSEDWRETSDSRSTSNYVKNRMVPVSKTKDDHKSVTCSECGRKCPSTSHLKVHMRIHTGEKPYICSQCGKGFRISSHLKSHMRTHTGECSSSLKTPVRSHTEEKPLICSQCDKCFTNSGNLKKHITIHTEEKPYICSHCGKCFRSKGNLKTHAVTHTRKT